MKKYFVLFVAFGFLFSFAVTAQQLEIHHINVGQADATLIKSPTGTTMLIDAGNDGNGTNIVLPYLSSLGITSLSFIVCSHYHADHLGGLDEVINSLGAANIGAIYDRGSDAPLPTTTAFNSYVSAANATGKRHTITLGQTLDLGGGVTMQCLATDGEVYNFGVVPNAGSSENDLSIGWLLNFNSFQYYTGGDLGGETTTYADNETPLAPQVGNVDVFKINHHGSRYSTNQTFVNTLQPEVGIISVGTNSYGHPTQVVIDRLVAANCYIYQTATGSGGTIPSGKGVVANNHIIVKTSGTSYTVSYGSTTHNYPGDAGTDVTPPFIINVQATDINSTSATITWTTDEASNSIVEYGLTTSYGSTVSNSSMITNHSITLINLTPNMVYHYRVKSNDASGNIAVDVDHSFQTGNSFSYAPTGATILLGTLNSGSYTNLATNNASYYVVNSTTSGTRKTDWYGSVTISQAPSSITKLTITYDGKNSRSIIQTLHLYNWVTSTWVQIDSRTVGTSDVTITNTQTSPANYISASGQIRLRVLGTGTNKNFTCSGDYMRFTVETSGTVISKQYTLNHTENQKAAYLLYQNFPNPFNPTTNIRFELANDARVNLILYDVLGREVARLVEGDLKAGVQDITFDGSNLSSGVYYYQLTVIPNNDKENTIVKTMKLMLVK